VCVYVYVDFLYAQDLKDKKKYFCKSDSPGGLYMELKLKGTL